MLLLKIGRSPKDENWRDTLPDGIKGDASLANFEDIGQLAQGFLDAKTYQGASIKIPGEDAGDEDRKAFHDKMLDKMPNLMYKPDFENPEQSVEFYRTLGMPELAEGYALPEFEVPDGIEVQNDKAEGFRQIAHKHGLTAAQFKGIMGDVFAQDVVAAQAGMDDNKANLAAVKEKFGMAHDDNMGKINTMLAKTGAPEGLIDGIKNGLVGVDTVNWLYQMGKQMGGEGFNFNDIGEGDTRVAKMTPEEARSAIDEINGNKEHAYWKGTGDEKKRATTRMIELMKYANPGASMDIQRA